MKKEAELIKEASDPAVFMATIEEFRNQISFDKIHIQTAIGLAIKSFDHRNCDFKKFSAYLKTLCETTGVQGKENAGKIALSLFNVLDSDKYRARIKLIY